MENGNYLFIYLFTRANVVLNKRAFFHKKEFCREERKFCREERKFCREEESCAERKKSFAVRKKVLP